MESSGSPSDGSVETIEESFSDKEADAERVDDASEECVPEENVTSEVPETSKECDLHPNKLDLANTGSADESPAMKAAGNSQLEPEVGMMFHSEDDAYVFYNTHAFRTGFSVRKGHLGRRRDGSIRDRIFLCSNEGTRQKHRTHDTKKPRAIVRTNCMARIEFKVNRDKLWVVNKVIYDHNHPLTPPSNTHLLRSHRKMVLSQEEECDEMDELGVIPATMYDISAEEAHETEGVMFLLKDQSSYLHTNRLRDLDKGDAQVLLDFLKTKQLEDPSFFYAIQLDVNEQVTNFFWADARSIIDYSYFGDVVTFDTTYRASKSDVPFAAFIGVNHHKQTVVFGTALLLDETTESFIWLFKTFMIAMSGQQPKTIFTDQCAAMSRAISMTLPNACHRLCLWHLVHNATEHISHACCSEPEFQKDFRSCIYESGTEEDFNALWGNLISKYDLASNSWLKELYTTRDKWALVYRRDSFCATMTTVQWGENMKNHVRKYFNRKLPLSKSLDQYSKALIRFREKELYEDYQSRQTKPVLLVDIPMLNEAANSYTRQIYMDFEHEFKSQLLCLCDHLGMDGTTYMFNVSLPDKRHYGIVEFNPTNYIVNCSCMKFETVGILCMHSLKVLNNNNILHLPSQYLMKRWTKYANDGMAFDRYQSNTDGQEPMTLPYSRVCNKAITIAVKSAFSEDALEMFEHELDKLMEEVEHVLRNAPSQRQENSNIVDDLQQNTLETSKKKQSQKGRPKDAAERKRKRKTQTTCNLNEMGIPHQPSQGQTNNSSTQLMVNESSHGLPFHCGGATSYGNGIQVQSCGASGCASLPPEMDMPPQESFAPSQGIFDHAVESQGANNPSIMWSRGLAGVPVPFVQGQPSNFINWVVQSPNIPNVDISQGRPDQQRHSSVPSQHQLMSRKLHFDINKGN